jgi:hypothetical protein
VGARDSSREARERGMRANCGPLESLESRVGGIVRASEPFAHRPGSLWAHHRGTPASVGGMGSWGHEIDPPRLGAAFLHLLRVPWPRARGIPRVGWRSMPSSAAPLLSDPARRFIFRGRTSARARGERETVGIMRAWSARAASEPPRRPGVSSSCAGPWASWAARERGKHETHASVRWWETRRSWQARMS